MKRFLSLILMLCIVLAVPLFGCTQVSGATESEGVDLSAYTEEFFEQKALIFLCQLTDYRSWSFYDLFIEDGTVFLYGAAEKIIYYNSAGDKQEGVKKAYCFCVEVEKSLVQSATEVEYCIEVYDWVERV